MRDLVVTIVFRVVVHCLRAGFDVGSTLTIEFHDRLTLFVYTSILFVPRTNKINGANGSRLKSETLLLTSRGNKVMIDFYFETMIEQVGCNLRDWLN